MALRHPTTTILLLTTFLFTCNADDGSLGYLCNEDTSGNSRISANIDKILPVLVSKASLGHFATTSGQGFDKVYGLAQCRGDVSKADCSSCLKEAAQRIRLACRNQPDSRIWYDYCFLRYNIENFIRKLDTSFGFLYINVKNVTTHQPSYNKAVASLLGKIKSEAAVAKNKGLAKSETKFSSSVTIYALVQCNGDLAAADCTRCVDKALSHFPKYCTNRKGCKLLYSNCYVRHELYPFFFPQATNSSAPVGSTFVVQLED